MGIRRRCGNIEAEGEGAIFIAAFYATSAMIERIATRKEMLTAFCLDFDWSNKVSAFFSSAFTDSFAGSSLSASWRSVGLSVQITNAA
jgi:hypothetical protein